MHADSAFMIGRSHQDCARPCQDYALAGAAGGLAWAIVSDGCSTGGHSDIGARLWSHAAQRVLTSTGDLPHGLDTLHTALLQRAAPLLQPFAAEDAYATLGMACSNGRQARAALFGDGLVAALMRNGELHSWELHYDLNAPRYPAYAGLDAQLECWQSMVRGSELSLRVQRLDAAGTVLRSDIHRHDAASYPGLWLSWDGIADLQALLVCTDGAGSTPGQSSQDTLRELLQIKNGTGQFMQRRLGAMARASRKGQARPPVDDLAAAALWWGDKP